MTLHRTTSAPHHQNQNKNKTNQNKNKRKKKEKKKDVFALPSVHFRILSLVLFCVGFVLCWFCVGFVIDLSLSLSKHFYFAIQSIQTNQSNQSNQSINHLANHATLFSNNLSPRQTLSKSNPNQIQIKSKSIQINPNQSKSIQINPNQSKSTQTLSKSIQSKSIQINRIAREQCPMHFRLDSFVNLMEVKKVIATMELQWPLTPFLPFLCLLPLTDPHNPFSRLILQWLPLL